MKAHLSHKNNDITIDIEGTADEILKVINDFISTPTPKTKVVQPAIAKAVTPKAGIDQTLVDKLLGSIYTYKAQPTGPGKGRYVMAHIMDGNVHLEKTIMANLKVTKEFLNEHISKVRAQGAVIEYTDGMIQLMSIPTRKYVQKRRRTDVYTKPKAVTPQVAVTSAPVKKATNKSAFAGVKLK